MTQKFGRLILPFFWDCIKCFSRKPRSDINQYFEGLHLIWSQSMSASIEYVPEEFIPLLGFTQSEFPQRFLQGSKHTFDYAIALKSVHRCALLFDIESMCKISYRRPIKHQIITTQDVLRWTEQHDYFLFNELNKLTINPHNTGYFDICSTATVRYWFSAFVRGKIPAKSIYNVCNNPLILILSVNSFGVADFVFSVASQLFISSLILVAYRATKIILFPKTMLNWSLSFRLHLASLSWYFFDFPCEAKSDAIHSTADQSFIMD